VIVGTGVPPGSDSWLAELAASPPFGEGDRLGSLNHLDASARRRAAAAIRSGEAISLARPLVAEPSLFDGGGESVELRTEVHAHGARDRVRLECHGALNTHLDAPNHVSVDGTFYGEGGFSAAPTVSEGAAHGIFTRAVLADLPALRGTDWVAPGEPATAAELVAAVAGQPFEPGDALLCYLGRDCYEAEGGDYPADLAAALSSGVAIPGIAPDVGGWLVERRASLIGWDFLDIPGGALPPLRVHRLIRAIGLAVLDHCELGRAAKRCRETGAATGALVVAPLATGGTGSMVNPLLVL
jgi:kynurenine formamidase